MDSSETLACLEFPNCDCARIRRHKGRIGEFVSNEGFTVFPFIEDNHIYLIGGGASRTELVSDSLIINSVLYHDVAVIHNDVVLSEHSEPCRFYFSKHIGIVRKERLEENTVWNLVEYSVVQ